MRDSCGMTQDCAAETQAMFGPELMVAPQLHLEATSREVYLPQLPAGQVWQNYFTNQSLGMGGNTLSEPTPLAGGAFPLYRRVAGVAPPSPPAPSPGQCTPKSLLQQAIHPCKQASRRPRPNTGRGEFLMGFGVAVLRPTTSSR